MRRGIATAFAAALLGVLGLPAGASAERIAGVEVTPGCDYIAEGHCLLPFPNDHFTRRDESTPTGRRLDLRESSTPRNRSGVPISPHDQNRADGFSPGSPIVVRVPGLDTLAAGERSNLPPVTDIGQSLRWRSPVVVINARTQRRHLVWAEIDSNASKPEFATLIIRPGKNFKEGERYIVALRNLRREDGSRIRAPRGFRLFRDGIHTGSRKVERRRRHFERIFRSLRRAGVQRHNLYLAWDFTVASQETLAGRMLHIRDDAFRELGDANLRDLKVEGASPSFTIDKVTDLTAAEDDRIARKVEGTLTAPCYLTNACAPGGRFTLDFEGRPQRQGTTTTQFVCNIPRSALDPASPAKVRPSLYGHGLLGRPTEINAGNVRTMSNVHGFMFCATAWTGFANEDIVHIAGTVIPNLSNFDTVADRMQQGFLHQLLLGRAMIHPAGLSAHPAFQKGGESVINTQRLFYDGNSQGGIMGGGLTAVAPDYNRAVLGVPGMNYSTLLQRSVDFDRFAAFLYPSYPNEIERQLMFAMIQLLWDRGEANGYAQHMTRNPLPNTPAHKVLLHVAFGDHQVADVTAEVEARTIGAHVYRPVLDPGRSPWRRFQLVPSIPRFPFNGSAVVVWDTGPIRGSGEDIEGTDAPPATNQPNRSGDDPHENPRATPSAQLQKSEFLKVGGRVIDVCGGRPCYALPYTGPSPAP